MASVRIGLPAWLAADPTAVSFSTAFSSNVYRCRLRWDNRIEPARVMRSGEDPQTGGWRMDLLTNTGAPLLLGRKLVITDDMWSLFHYIPGVPLGALRVRRVNGDMTDPGLYDLGGAVVLEYVV